MESPLKEQQVASSATAENKNRINRSTYLVSSFVALIPIIIGVIIDVSLGFIELATFVEQDFGPFSLISIVLAFIYMIYIGIKRLHDFDASGWWTLLFFIPFVSFGFSIALYVFPGTKGANSYGELPSSKLLYWFR